MLVLLAILTAGLIVSLIPFIYPATVMNTIGVFLNHMLAQLLAAAGLGAGSLFTGADGLYDLTLPGVLALYAPPMLLLLWAYRTR